jgi:hypothetical protein
MLLVSVTCTYNVSSNRSYHASNTSPARCQAKAKVADEMQQQETVL